MLGLKAGPYQAWIAGLGLFVALVSGRTQAQPLAGASLTRALQGGGYVLLMRHASSPQAPPAAADADPGNPGHERQLDAAGRRAAMEMGQAIATLRLPIGEVWSSPAYRAVQTVWLAGLPTPKTAPELGDRGQSMRAADADQGAWLRARVAARPKARTDTVIVTHFPNISAVYGLAADGLADGEALVLHPDGKGAPEPVARIKVEDWPALAGH